MKLSGLVLLAAFTVSFVDSKSQRLNLFRKHHGTKAKKNVKLDRLSFFRKYHGIEIPEVQISASIKISESKRAERSLAVRTVCNVQTCNKCANILKSNSTGMNKVKKGCRSIVGLQNCCSTKLLRNHTF